MKENDLQPQKEELCNYSKSEELSPKGYSELENKESLDMLNKRADATSLNVLPGGWF